MLLISLSICRKPFSKHIGPLRSPKAFSVFYFYFCIFRLPICCWARFVYVYLFEFENLEEERSVEIFLHTKKYGELFAIPELPQKIKFLFTLNSPEGGFARVCPVNGTHRKAFDGSLCQRLLEKSVWGHIEFLVGSSTTYCRSDATSRRIDLPSTEPEPRIVRQSCTQTSLTAVSSLPFVLVPEFFCHFIILSTFQ